MDQSGTIAAIMARLDFFERRVMALERRGEATPLLQAVAHRTISPGAAGDEELRIWANRTSPTHGEVMRLWRECGLPEYFLGNGGSNHKLVEFARRIRDVAA